MCYRRGKGVDKVSEQEEAISENTSLKKKKIVWILGAVLGVILVTVVLLIAFFSRDTYSTLFGIIDKENANEIIIKLDEEGIPYEYSNDEIFVLDDYVYNIRTELILEGYFEEIEETKDQTNSVENEERIESETDQENALSKYDVVSVFDMQDEVARIILEEISGLDDAIVQIAMLDAQIAQAVVISLDMKNGKKITEKQYNQIREIAFENIVGDIEETLVILDAQGETISY